MHAQSESAQTVRAGQYRYGEIVVREEVISNSRFVITFRLPTSLSSMPQHLQTTLLCSRLAHYQRRLRRLCLRSLLIWLYSTGSHQINFLSLGTYSRRMKLECVTNGSPLKPIVQFPGVFSVYLSRASRATDRRFCERRCSSPERFFLS